MKQVNIIGIGMSAATTTAEAMERVREAEVLLGAKRMTDEFSFLGKRTHSVYQPDEVTAVIKSTEAERFAVLVSGDVGFYSGAAGLYERLREYEIKLIPGVSTVSYFFAKCGLPWQDAALISCHGTEQDVVGAVRRNKMTFVLTGGNIRQIRESLCTAGFGCLKARVGENLGIPEERIAETTVAAMQEEGHSSLSVLLIENEDYDQRVRTGIADTEFIRSDIPMTKSEVRAACLSKLALRPTDICYDIGCGTGSVTVEMALSAYKGRVYAVDKSKAALALTAENCAAFHLGNVAAVSGTAPEALSALPSPDAAFIGGSSGNISGIVGALLMKNPIVRIVITAVTIESVAAAIGALEKAGISPEIAQLSVAHAKEIGGLHMMNAQNPVFVISGGANG